ncbi:MAG TPA: PH domain-containing protein [Actinoplanes sp.]|nr:PH domain-containing protein [Actinoplanes sp.]
MSDTGPLQPTLSPPPVPEEPRQRLHPLSPLLKGAKSIAVIIAALSWQTLGSVGFTDFALIVLGLAVAVVVFSAIGWWNTGYHIVGRELRITEGLVWRRNRAIPLDRLQAVELRRPLLAQLTGLAELRLEVVGGGKTEAPLAYLTVQNASALRERLLALSGRTEAIVFAPAEPGAPATPAEPPPLFQVRNQDLLVSQLLTPQAFLLPLGIAWVITQFAMEGSWTFIGIGGTVTAMAGVLLQPIRKVLRDWDFRLIRGERLILHYGLTETRSQVVPPHRVQAVRITWPFLWRAKRWLHLSFDVAGLSGPEPGDDNRSDRLMPVGDPATARALVEAALPGVDLVTLATSPPPARAWWLHPFGLRFYGAGLAADVFVSRSGRITREMTLVPYARLQSVRVVQGPLQRRLGLATVYADTAGGRAGEARDRDLTEAYAIADQLSARARQARTPAPTGRPAPSPAPGRHISGPDSPGDVPQVPDEPVDDTFWQRPGRT